MRKKEKLLVQEVRKRGRPLGSIKIHVSAKKREFNKLIGVVDNRFKKGNSGGPGRPVGSRSKVMVALEQMGEDNAILVYKKLVALALEGDIVACKIILDRVFPAPKRRKIEFDIKDSVRTPKDISEFSATITDMMVTGELSPEESIEIGNRIEQHLKIITDVDIMNKIEGTCKRIDGIPKVGD